MKRFILKTLWFVLPYTSLFLLMIKFYSIDKGDLLRIGYIIDLFPSYRQHFKDEFETPIRYTAISEKSDQKKFEILAIGDSFSEQSSFGYKNLLAQNTDLLYIDRFLSIADNPIQTLYALINGDFFDEYKVNYVILQSAERAFTVRVNDIDKNRIINIHDIFDQIENHNGSPKLPRYNFFSNQVFMFLYNSFQYFTKADYCFESLVCKTQMNRSDLFSINTNSLLFYIGDLHDLNANNDLQKVKQLNRFLNKLSELLQKKQIKLIVLPAPDKYSIYYKYIVSKDKYEKPLFFQHLEKEIKDYIYIESDKILKNAIENDNDIYFFDDSHWSPKAAKIVSSEILKEIQVDHENQIKGLIQNHRNSEVY